MLVFFYFRSARRFRSIRPSFAISGAYEKRRPAGMRSSTPAGATDLSTPFRCDTSCEFIQAGGCVRCAVWRATHDLPRGPMYSSADQSRKCFFVCVTLRRATVPSVCPAQTAVSFLSLSLCFGISSVALRTQQITTPSCLAHSHSTHTSPQSLTFPTSDLRGHL